MALPRSVSSPPSSSPPVVTLFFYQLALLIWLANSLLPSPLSALIRTVVNCVPGLSTQLSRARRGGRSLTIFDLPPRLRNRIYWLVLHGGPDASPPWPEADLLAPGENLGLLCASRQVYREAVAVLYDTVNLGPDARKARDYLVSLGPERVAHIRHLGLFHDCQHDCSRHAPSCRENWNAVFDLLWQWWVCVRSVDVYFRPCLGDPWTCKGCRLRGAEPLAPGDHQGFWSGLGLFLMAREIRFISSVPEYYARNLAWQLGWSLDGRTVGGYRDSQNATNTFVGSAVNPWYPGAYRAISLCRYPRNRGVAVSTPPCKLVTEGVRREPAVDTRKGGSALRVAENSSTRQPRQGLLELPGEIRRHIYDLACSWEYRAPWPNRPARLNTGAGLLLTSKQVSAEALPSVYRKFRIYGGRHSETIARLGANLSHIQHLEIWFSCFCPWGGIELQRSMDSIYALHGRDPQYPTPKLFWDYRYKWSKTMHQIRTLHTLSELTVTFQTCCRSASPARRPFAPGRDAPADQRQCRDLEDYLAHALSLCHNVQKLSLAGNVPPGLGIRLTRPGPGGGMTVKLVSSAMAAYLEAVGDTIKERHARRVLGLIDDDEGLQDEPPYPGNLERPEDAPVPHFVLVREDTARARWAEHVAQGRWARPPPGMELVAGPSSIRRWWKVAEYIDRVERRGR